MKLYFDHILGKQKNEDFVFSLISATFDDSEWDWAFDNGWLPAQKWFDTDFSNTSSLVWYQSRQSRIKICDYKPSDKTKKLVKNTPVTYKITTELLCAVDDIYSIYTDYCLHKKFGDMISEDDFTTYFNGTNHYYIHFYIDDVLVAFTKLSLWSQSLLTEVFWWNYSNPELCIGKLSAYLEIEIAKKLNLPYLYTGISYGTDSIYKSSKKGFQFWTGRLWSSDALLFTQLCNTDDQIKSIDALHKYQYEYLKILKV